MKKRQHDIAHKEFYSIPENVKDLVEGFVDLDCVKEFVLSEEIINMAPLFWENETKKFKKETKKYKDETKKYKDETKILKKQLKETEERVTKSENRAIESEKKVKETEKRNFNAFYKLIKNGRITVNEAAEDIGISINELLAQFKQYNLVL